MTTEAIVSLMIDAGFSKPLAEIYTHLVNVDAASAAELLEVTHYDSNTIRQVAVELLRIKVVAMDNIRDEYILYALNPQIVWDAFASEVLWSLAKSPEYYAAPRYHYSLPEGNKGLMIYVREKIHRIKEAATQVYQDNITHSITKHRWRDAVNTREMAIILAEAILQAKSKIYSVSKPPRLPQVSLIWESIMDRMTRGVAYQRITNLTEVIEHGLYIVERDIKVNQIDLSVLDISEMLHKFYVIDRSFLVVYHSTGFEDNGQVGRITDQKSIIDRYRKRFDAYQEDAIPGLFVVDRLKKAADQIINRAIMMGYEDAEVNWLACLKNWGTFCNIEDPLLDSITNLEKRAFHQGLITYGTTGKPVLNYNLDYEDISDQWLKNRI